MVLAVALDDVKANHIAVGSQLVGRKGDASRISFIGSRTNPDLPLASLNQHTPGRYSSTHFHVRDQFQVVVAGGGTLGRHVLTPYSVHFSRAYTPYGPLRADATTGLTFFVMRPHPDTGSQHLPEEQEQLDNAADRRPWQITRQATFPELQSVSGPDALLQAMPDITDDRGLAAYTLSMKPNAKAQPPDPSNGDGQFLVVVKGSILHSNKIHKALALVFVAPNEPEYQIQAGEKGLQALILNFPRPQSEVGNVATSVHEKSAFKLWQCALCAFVYDEAAGLPAEGIAPGTRWADVPDTWTCPDCSSSKEDFRMNEV